MDWKKEFKSWGLILSFFALLYFTGMLPVVQGGLQSIFLYTGLIEPNVGEEDLVDRAFDYRARFLDFEGNEVNLEDYKGKTLFINLWASWCGPCRAEMPHISELYKKVKNQPNLAFLMIGLDDDYMKSKKLIDGKSWSFPAVHASYGLNQSLRSRAIPTSLVVSPEGKIVFYHEGMSNFNTEEFKSFLLNL